MPSQKVTLLITLWSLAVMSAAYFVIASTTVNNVRRVHKLKVDRQLGSFDSALMYSIMLTSILSVAKVVWSIIVLTGRSFSHHTTFGGWYSSVFTSSLWLGFVYIQAGLITKGFVGKATLFWENTHYWSGTDTTFIRLLYVLSFFMGFAWIAFGIMLICYKHAFAVLRPYSPRTGHHTPTSPMLPSHHSAPYEPVQNSPPPAAAHPSPSAPPPPSASRPTPSIRPPASAPEPVAVTLPDDYAAAQEKAPDPDAGVRI